MARFHDWPERLEVYLRASRALPFAWGAHDCVTFAFGAVEAMTGVAHVAAYRGRYDGAVGAARCLIEDGPELPRVSVMADDAESERVRLSALLQAGVCRRLGDPLPSPRLAQRGDIAVFPQPEGDTLAVVTGSTMAIVTPAGLYHVPLAHATVAWRV